MEGRQRLGVGFGYRGWLEEFEKTNVPGENEAVVRGTPSGKSSNVPEGPGICGEQTEVSSPVETERRRGMDERTDSVRTSLYLEHIV